MFLDCIHHALVFQRVYVYNPVMIIDVLDLFITNDEDMIDDIRFLSPSGKSNHSVLLEVIRYTKTLKDFLTRKGYNKANFKEAV